MFQLLWWVLLASSYCPSEAATIYTIVTRYAGTSCASTPYVALAVENSTCSSAKCYEYSVNASNERVSIECTTDYVTALRKSFEASKYVLVEQFEDEECKQFGVSYAFPALGSFVGTLYGVENFSYAIASLNSNGSASIQLFNDSLGAPDTLFEVKTVEKETLASHSCSNGTKWYSSLDEAASNGLSAGTIMEIALGMGGVAVLFALGIKYRRRKLKDEEETDGKLLHGLLNDEVIIANRLPRDKILVKEILSRGAYGEVYTGTFKHDLVAVKMLSRSTCKSLQHVRDFLSEAKLTAALDHPRIVSFIGLAWDALSDLCLVLEFMDNRDLRSLLDKNLELGTPQGLTQVKIQVALHVCEALTYLHSLSAPVIHRDLKSRNVLLNREMHAKLSDFGISRQQVGQTMTAGVGTSLWMAPEVMLGERYGVKADMFSFGVLLSELDVHTLPYTQTKQQILHTEGRLLPDVTLMQMIVTGAAHVEFSQFSPDALVELGCACVSIHPDDRPSASQALYQLHQCQRAAALRPFS
ncbi:hypothetical protein DVH05_003601 [Phytophthora capsici]|nr:hypothetical protein DVH05_003601 [Phytophthora capsici]